MFTCKWRIGKGKWHDLLRATGEAAATFETGKPGLPWRFLTKAARPGIIVVEDCLALGRLIAKDVCLGFRVIFHPIIGIEVIGIDIRHNSYLRADGMWCESFELPA